MCQVQENIEDVMIALDNAKSHCMCLKFEETDTHYRVIYPSGYFPEGAQVHKGMGKAKALNKLVEVMERHFKNNY